MENPEDQQPPTSPSFIPIPKIFYSDLTDQPLTNCVTCDRNLIEKHEPYIIEKAFRYYQEYDIHNTIFEYIMCIPCAQKMNASMSKESLEKIQTYFGQLDMIGRKQKLIDEHGTDLDGWIDQCLIKETPRANMEEYQICAQCIGDQLVFDVLPYMLSHEASNEIVELLSAQTLEEYDRFVDDNFGLPPAFKKALKESPVLV